MSYLILTFLLLNTAFAGLEKLHLKNVNLNYLAPEGTGDFEKIDFGWSLFAEKYPVLIYRREKNFEIDSTFANFEWVNPFKFVHNFESASVVGVNLKLDRVEHVLAGETIRFKPEGLGEFSLDGVSVKCKGESTQEDLVLKIQEDCLTKLDAEVDHLELPLNLLQSISENLPEAPVETDIPAKDFALSIVNGSFSSSLRVKLIIPANLKIWGFAQVQDAGKTFAIRIDEVKFGVLPVTALVMYELQQQIKHPGVSINPPWIKIKLGRE